MALRVLGQAVAECLPEGDDDRREVIADPAVRAQRRLEQMDLPTDPDSIAEEVARIEERDRADSSRDVAPLKQAEDAVLLDTTHLSFAEQVRRIVELALGKVRGPGQG